MIELTAMPLGMDLAQMNALGRLQPPGIGSPVCALRCAQYWSFFYLTAAKKYDPVTCCSDEAPTDQHRIGFHAGLGRDLGHIGLRGSGALPCRPVILVIMCEQE